MRGGISDKSLTNPIKHPCRLDEEPRLRELVPADRCGITQPRLFFFQIWYACAYLGEPEALVERDVEPGALEALRLHALLVGVGVLARLPAVHRRRPRGQAEVLECVVFKLQG